MTPLKAIKEKCLDCCCGQLQEVKFCELESCPLYEFRLGKGSKQKREYTEEQRAEMRDRLAKARAKKIE